MGDAVWQHLSRRHEPDPHWHAEREPGAFWHTDGEPAAYTLAEPDAHCGRDAYSDF